jgi:hypothetical protein
MRNWLLAIFTACRGIKAGAQQNEHWPIQIELQATTERHEATELDEGYRNFVERMWSMSGVTVNGIELPRKTYERIFHCALVSVVQDERGSVCVNVLEDGHRRTYAGDDRHAWARGGQWFDVSAFLGILKGADPEEILKPDRRPLSVEEALSERCDHHVTNDRRYLIHYCDSQGRLSYRVISRIYRHKDRFSASCHFRWGARRTFAYEGLLGIVDASNRQAIPIDEFIHQPAPNVPKRR